MSNHPLFDAIIVLGGGRNKNGLTPLSTARLDKGWDLFQQGLAPKVFALGGYYSTYGEDAIRYEDTGAELRKNYLLSKGNITEQDVIMVNDGRDTIQEAFASRKTARELGFNHLLLVTSEIHIPRALYLFQRILGRGIDIYGNVNTSALTGDLLLVEEEKAYLELWQHALSQYPEEIPQPESWEIWYAQNKPTYEEHRRIRDLFHPPGGIESQAYTGRREVK